MFKVRIIQTRVAGQESDKQLEIRLYRTKAAAIKGAQRSVEFYAADGHQAVKFDLLHRKVQTSGSLGALYSSDLKLWAHIWEVLDGDRVDI